MYTRARRQVQKDSQAVLGTRSWSWIMQTPRTALTEWLLNEFAYGLIEWDHHRERCHSSCSRSAQKGCSPPIRGVVYFPPSLLTSTGA